MAERPILFSAPMVRALLSGRKTMHRSVLKLPKKTFSGGPIYERPDMGGWEPTTSGGGGCFTFGKNGEKIPAPELVAIWHRTTGVCMATPIQPGDLLWVREAWRVWSQYDDVAPGRIPASVDVQYAADKPISPWVSKARPSIHMPRWASRLTLEVTGVKVERLQDISEEDAVAEGCPGRLGPNQEFPDEWDPSPCEEFEQLWKEVYGADAWSKNPWCAAISFVAHHTNIDTLARKEAAE